MHFTKNKIKLQSDQLESNNAYIKNIKQMVKKPYKLSVDSKHFYTVFLIDYILYVFHLDSTDKNTLNIFQTMVLIISKYFVLFQGCGFGFGKEKRSRGFVRRTKSFFLILLNEFLT